MYRVQLIWVCKLVDEYTFLGNVLRGLCRYCCIHAQMCVGRHLCCGVAMSALHAKINAPVCANDKLSHINGNWVIRVCLTLCVSWITTGHAYICVILHYVVHPRSSKTSSHTSSFLLLRIYLKNLQPYVHFHLPASFGGVSVCVVDVGDRATGVFCLMYTIACCFGIVALYRRDPGPRELVEDLWSQ